MKSVTVSGETKGHGLEQRSHHSLSKLSGVHAGIIHNYAKYQVPTGSVSGTWVVWVTLLGSEDEKGPGVWDRVDSKPVKSQAALGLGSTWTG